VISARRGVTLDEIPDEAATSWGHRNGIDTSLFQHREEWDLLKWLVVYGKKGTIGPFEI